MSHEPPVPSGNQSPYPLQEAPHAPQPPAAPPLPGAMPDAVPPAIVAATTPLAPAPVTIAPAPPQVPAPSPSRSPLGSPSSRALPVGRIVGAAAGAGAVVFGIAALLFPRAPAKPRKGKRRRK